MPTKLLPVGVALCLCLPALALHKKPKHKRHHTGADVVRHYNASNYSVWATHEGQLSGKMANGEHIERYDIFVALPSKSALGRKVVVSANGKSFIAEVKDVGPHYTNDDYWNSGVPKAQRVKTSNKAAIDLSDALWDSLGLNRRQGIAKVSWRFHE